MKLAPARIGLGKASSNHNDRFHSARSALVNHTQHGIAGNRNDSQIDGLGKRSPADGTLELSPFWKRLVRYTFDLQGDDGRTYHFDGRKNITTRRFLRSWTTLPGTLPGEVLVTGHLCHPQPGANDNASGAAAVLETARVPSRCATTPT